MKLQITKYGKAEKGMAYLVGKPCLSGATENMELLIESLLQKYKITHPRFGKMDRLSQLGFTLADMVLQNTKLSEKHNPYQLGIVLSNSASSLDTDKKYWESVSSIPSPGLFVYTLPNIVLAEISIKNNFKGENYFFVSEKPDCRLLFYHISEMLHNKRLDACLGGWVEVLNDQYNAFIFLVEKDQPNAIMEFTEENISTLYNTTPLWNS